ncbi:hypothetical protein L211DRAFT_838749 [Terfezia boudieri ATCC MYA-4762]|uniref:Uncharacterized protein n=1 Tax=Terfezia boudieri ATCC MYA-4762 TaxID=1051890 RepID=A0A3N4LYV7_9PEZI|nr:hypothetical protein L211DRAFT_838749 [Terfezia boudieri ATCC MYA-4762]
MFRLPEASGVESTGEAGIPEIKDTDVLGGLVGTGGVVIGVVPIFVNFRSIAKFYAHKFYAHKFYAHKFYAHQFSH